MLTREIVFTRHFNVGEHDVDWGMFQNFKCGGHTFGCFHKLKAEFTEMHTGQNAVENRDLIVDEKNVHGSFLSESRRAGRQMRQQAPSETLKKAI